MKQPQNIAGFISNYYEAFKSSFPLLKNGTFSFFWRTNGTVAPKRGTIAL